jgi:hypothetical protein
VVNRELIQLYWETKPLQEIALQPTRESDAADVLQQGFADVVSSKRVWNAARAGAF